MHGELWPPEGALHRERCAGALGGQGPRRRRGRQAAVWAVAAGSEWFYPEGPARPFSLGTGAAAFSLAMAFTFAAFCYMLALLLTAALIFFAIWHIIAFDELKTDYKNPIDQCNTLNPVSYNIGCFSGFLNCFCF